MQNIIAKSYYNAITNQPFYKLYIISDSFKLCIIIIIEFKD